MLRSVPSIGESVEARGTGSAALDDAKSEQLITAIAKQSLRMSPPTCRHSTRADRRHVMVARTDLPFGARTRTPRSGILYGVADAFSDAAILNIDSAAAEIRTGAEGWTESGLVVGPMTWHEAHSFPPQIVTDRDIVLTPDSVGVTIGEETGPFPRRPVHYGWVDLDIVNWTTDDVAATSGIPVRSVEEFGSFLDDVHERLVAGTDL